MINNNETFKVNDTIKYIKSDIDNNIYVANGVITKIVNTDLIVAKNLITNLDEKIHTKDVLFVLIEMEDKDNKADKVNENSIINMIGMILIIILLELFTIFVTYTYLYNFPHLLNIEYSINNTITETVNTMYDYINTNIFSSIGITTYT